ncbi:MAG: ParB-like nuclease [Novosphingobium sp.]|nr:ParB-like nuclease [Novosphingobium sp.]
MMLQVPIGKLHLSSLNARVTNRDIDIESLADNIQARGLKQNLVVVETAEFPGVYEVVAGGRRLQALQLLVKRKAMKKTDMIPVLVEPRSEGRETSLAENVDRVPMNPADEVKAFADVVAEYELKGILDPTERIKKCAGRFGVSENHIQQRLRLADLSPVVLDALRTAVIGLDAAKAYAMYNDHELQERVFKAQEAVSSNKHRVSDVRDGMRQRTYSRSEPKVRYVGLDAYLAAGGRTDRDIFMGTDAGEILLQPALVDRLAAEKAAAEIAEVAAATGCAGGLLADRGPYGYVKFPSAPKGLQYSRTGKVLSDLGKEAKSEATLVFSIAEDGDGLNREEAYLVPRKEPAAVSSQIEETPEQREEQAQLRTIRARAFRLAVPPVAGTPFQGRAYLPSATDWIQTVEDLGDGKYLVALLIEVTEEELQAAMPEAERILAQERAAADEAGDDVALESEAA